MTQYIVACYSGAPFVSSTIVHSIFVHMDYGQGHDMPKRGLENGEAHYTCRYTGTFILLA